MVFITDIHVLSAAFFRSINLCLPHGCAVAQTLAPNKAIVRNNRKAGARTRE
jgi:hypothetical protein